MTEPLVTVEDLSVRYTTSAGVVQAVTDASLTIERGEAVALIGESGSGKSTLAKAILRLLPSSAAVTAGTMRLTLRSQAAVDLTAASEHALQALRWAELGYVSQASISAFNPVLTIGAHFRETALAHGPWTRSLQARAHDLIAAVRLDPGRILSAFPHELSGGTRQRVAIALALLLEPSLVVLDEPTTALDVLTQREVLDILVELRARTQTSLLFVSHDLSVAGYVADRIVTMYAGRVVEDAPALALTNAPAHPYSIGLLRAMPSLDGELSAQPVRGQPPSLLDPPSGCPFHPRCPEAVPICAREMPELTPRGADGRRIACWRREPAVNLPAGLMLRAEDRR